MINRKKNASAADVRNYILRESRGRYYLRYSSDWNPKKAYGPRPRIRCSSLHGAATRFGVRVRQPAFPRGRQPSLSRRTGSGEYIGPAVRPMGTRAGVGRSRRPRPSHAHPPKPPAIRGNARILYKRFMYTARCAVSPPGSLYTANR